MHVGGSDGTEGPILELTSWRPLGSSCCGPHPAPFLRRRGWQQCRKCKAAFQDWHYRSLLMTCTAKLACPAVISAYIRTEGHRLLWRYASIWGRRKGSWCDHNGVVVVSPCGGLPVAGPGFPGALGVTRHFLPSNRVRRGSRVQDGYILNRVGFGPEGPERAGLLGGAMGLPGIGKPIPIPHGGKCSDDSSLFQSVPALLTSVGQYLFVS